MNMDRHRLKAEEETRQVIKYLKITGLCRADSEL